MNLDVKTTALAAAFLLVGVAGANAQAIDPGTDVPQSSRSGTQVQTGEPVGVPPPGLVTGDPVPVAPQTGFGFGPGAGGGIVVEPEVTPVPVEPAPEPMLAEPEVEEDID